MCRVRRRGKGEKGKSICDANNSSPGPDGIPFLAWRRCASFSASILFEAAQFIHGGCESGLTAEEAKEYNASLMFLLPKKPAGILPTGEGYFAPAETRPLSGEHGQSVDLERRAHRRRAIRQARHSGHPAWFHRRPFHARQPGRHR